MKIPKEEVVEKVSAPLDEKQKQVDQPNPAPSVQSPVEKAKPNPPQLPPEKPAEKQAEEEETK